MAEGHIRFVEYHRPPLEAGDYRLRVEHHLHAGVGDAAATADPPLVYSPTALHFSVAGERLAVGDALVHSVSPAQGSTTPCQRTLPHIIFERSTFPWERKPCPQEADHGSAPWVALLVFDTKTAPASQIVTASALDHTRNPRELEAKGAQPSDWVWPGIELESAQHGTDPVAVIDVPWARLRGLVPSHTELRYLAHVRSAKSGDDPWREQATVVAGRLPAPGALYVAHLVSLEGRYQMPAWQTPEPDAVALDNAPGCEDLVALLRLAWDGVREDVLAPGHRQRREGQFDPAVYAAAATEGHPPAWHRGDIPTITCSLRRSVDHIGGQEVSVSRQVSCPGVADLAPLHARMPARVDAVAAWRDALLALQAPRVPGAAAAAAVAPEHIIDFTLATHEFGRLGVYFERSETADGDDRELTCVFGFLGPEPRFDAQGATDAHLIRLVSLRSWQFSCAPAGRDFVRLLTHLDTQSAEIGRRPRPDADGTLLEGGAATPYIHEPFGLPEAAVPYLLAGYSVLPHGLRGGDEVASWYRGPLLPNAPATSRVPLPARAADALLVYDEDTGLFDASFSAAWTLGRTLALADTSVSVELLHWKQRRRRELHLLAQRAAHPHVPLETAPSHDAETMPGQISSWLTRLARLEQVPFDYLVPDERLLPVESVRFFTVDPEWTACLLDGAFAVGRVLRKDALADESMMEGLLDRPRLSGVLIRSALVRGFPSVEIQGYGRRPGAAQADLETASHVDLESHISLSCVRRDRLGPDVLLCLFEGPGGVAELDVLDVHLHPQHLHFGFEEDSEGALLKIMRDPQTGAGAAGTLHLAPFVDATTRAVDVRGVFEEVAQHAREFLQPWQFTAADFAFQMLDAPPLVRFLRGGAPVAPSGLETLEGVGPAMASTLRTAGIPTLRALRGLLLQPEAGWPDVPGVSVDRLRGWAYHAELLMVPGVDEHLAELLEDAGVEGLSDLQRRDAATLTASMTELNEARRRAPAAPTVDDIEAWIEAAGRILAAATGATS